MRLSSTTGFVFVTICWLLVESQPIGKNRGRNETRAIRTKVQSLLAEDNYRRLERERRDIEGNTIMGNLAAYSAERLPGRDRPHRPMLSILNPLDVLRQRLLIEMNRRRLQMQAKENRKLLDNIGRRRKRETGEVLWGV
ncbi:uncharacterized protein LOC136031762 [Artemia franciscana]|uniref:Corticotropin-releasing factor domain-containing protein n=1 Tax=Artemia franciscana TaxID=6661 RepID=A0AA88ICF6_ARTSF|nr:hypothetical protein QYM36_000311 [Artemia franciscana]KAK2725779.1 hypothetical protein QYM36_000311 [Artemia franciscana]